MPPYDLFPLKPKKMPMCDYCLWQQGCRMHMLFYEMTGLVKEAKVQHLIEVYEAIEANYCLPFQEFHFRYSIHPSLRRFQRPEMEY